MREDSPRTAELLNRVEAIIKTRGISQSEVARELGEQPQQLSMWISRGSMMGEAALKVQEWSQKNLSKIMRRPAHRRLYESHLTIIKQRRKSHE